jgi:hypothetical protein
MRDLKAIEDLHKANSFDNLCKKYLDTFHKRKAALDKITSLKEEISRKSEEGFKSTLFDELLIARANSENINTEFDEVASKIKGIMEAAGISFANVFLDDQNIRVQLNSDEMFVGRSNLVIKTI